MTSSPTPSLVVFDLAGTTVRDSGEVPAAFKAALDAEGSGSIDDTIAQWRGASKLEAIRRIVTDRNPQMSEPQLARRVQAIYRVFRSDLMRRFLGAPELAIPEAQPTFERLRAAGISLALNTGFDR